MDDPVKIVAVPALEDNYIYFIVKGDRTVVVDPGEAKMALAFLQDKKLEGILNTHCHADHTAGNAELKMTGAKLYAPDDERIEGVDSRVKGGDHFTLLDERIEVIATPGHTNFDVTYYLPNAGVAFTADCLFSGGCGKLFEGSAKDMYKSLQKIVSLPDETKLYFGHEYTRKNLEFGRTIEPENRELAQALAGLEVPTSPTTVAREKEINVFVRAKDADVLKEIRSKKDTF
jgi:hydroxyacylglutathione hydrolase